MKLIVGLGNPEKRYDGTRHNVGFAALDVLTGRRPAGARPQKWKKDEDLNAWTLARGQTLFAKPLTYVNNTGAMVSAAQEKIHPEDVLFICDDVNLRFGKIRLRRAGSSGGHHGLESVAEWLNSENFSRLRIGVQNDRMPTGDVVPFVLGKFTNEEKKELRSILRKVAAVCEAWVDRDFEAAQNKLSRLQSTK